MANPLNSQVIAAKQATVKLAKQVADLQKTAEALTIAAKEQDTVIEQIAQKEAELAELSVQFNEKRRQADVEFDLALKENQAQKVAAVLKSQGNTVISTADLTKLQADFTRLTGEFNTAVEKEVNHAKSSAQAQLSAALKSKDLEQAAQNAEVKANVNSLNEKNALLAKQVSDLQAQIAADRSARVEEAKARGNAVVNVQSGK